MATKRTKDNIKKLDNGDRDKAIRVKGRTIPLTTLAGQHEECDEIGH
jgi:hypothetical protein